MLGREMSKLVCVQRELHTHSHTVYLESHLWSFLLFSTFAVASERKKLLSTEARGGEEDAEGDSTSTWCPDPAVLLARNDVLAQDPEMVGKRFDVPDSRAKSTPVSTCLGRLLPILDGKSLGDMPVPHETVFNAMLQSFCAAPGFAILAPAPTRMWLLVLLEALVVDDFGMTILPRTRASRVFTTVGHFVRVSSFGPFV